MEKGKLKISKSRRLELTIGKAGISIPKIFVFDHLEPGSYECEIERDKGAVLRILVNGKDIPRDEEAILKKQTQVAEKEAKDKHEKDLIKMYEQQENSGDSYVLEKAMVPLDTRKTLLYDCDNFHLKLNRFARFENVEGDEKFYFFNPKARKNKNREIILSEFEIKAEFNEDYIKEIAAKHKKQAEILLEQSLIISKFSPNWRLIVGLGGESVYETSITLHHIYGFPYIPASSIKGVLRSFIIAEKFENHEGKAIDCKNFCDVFGCPAEVSVEEDGKKKPFISHYKEARQGQVTFFDALPTKAPSIQPDIMNPHYGEWYSKGIAPTDTQSPVPVFFLTVQGTFQFLFGSKKIPDIKTQPFWGKTLEKWLEAALTQHGIGAKTAVGYGTGDFQSPQ